MPKSKRQKVVHLSKVEKKTKEDKQTLFDNVREAADNHRYIFAFSVENMRNTYLKEVRSEFADSRIIFGKTKVMAKALGSSPDDEHLPGLSGLTDHLTGSVGLLFTNREPAEVQEYFAGYSELDYARAGTVATRTFTVPAGVVYSRAGELPQEEDEPVPHSVEVTLRKWGMPTSLVRGKVVLNEEYQVCREGQNLDSNQTALLKMFGVATAEFRVELKAYWSAATQEVTVVDADEET